MQEMNILESYQVLSLSLQKEQKEQQKTNKEQQTSKIVLLSFFLCIL